MSSHVREHRTIPEEREESPPSAVGSHEASHDVPPPGIAPDHSSDGAPPTAEDAPTLVTPETAPDADRTGARSDVPAPRLADGVELVGRFEGSGFKEPPYIARRADGQMVQMPAMLYALAEVIDGEADHAELARRFSRRIERQVEPDMVATLIAKQLRPLGIVAAADGMAAELKKVDPLLALKFRTKVVPKGVVRALTTVFRPLFVTPVVVVVVLAFVALDVWLFGVHGISQSLRRVIYDPSLLFMLVGGVVIATAFHEIGHATGTRYGGAEPGVMGVGVYIVWPAFYTDITDAYRLGKTGRLRADMGGMYFNAVFALAIAGLYALTQFEPLLLLIVLQTFTIIQQSLPLLRLDGFYIISDLTGVPDMLTRIKPVLHGLIPGREPDPRVTELKTWVRGVVTGYVCTVVPLIGLLFLLMLVHAPRAFATGYDSFALHYARVGPAFSRGETGMGILNLFEMVMLVLPLVGMAYTTARIGKRAGVGAWNWSGAHPARRGTLVLGTVAATAAVAFLWWPHGDYRPIQPGEKGTVVSAFKGLRHLPSGHAALTPERARRLGGAPFVHDRATPAGRPDKVAPKPSSGTRTTTPTTPAAGSRPTTTQTTPAGGSPTTATPSAAAPPSTATQPGTGSAPATGTPPPAGTASGTATRPASGTTPAGSRAPGTATTPGQTSAPAGSTPPPGSTSTSAATPPPTSTPTSPSATTPTTTPTSSTSTSSTTPAPAVTTTQTAP
jgi:putative peptide zinc metalloprotease protein